MSFFPRRLTLRRKLTLLLLAACAVSLLLAGMALGVYEFVSLRRAQVRHLAAVGRIIAENAYAALTFDDAGMANDLLRGVIGDPGIEAACIYDEDGEPFARYFRDGLPEQFEPPPVQQGVTHSFSRKFLLMYVPVVAEGRVHGTVLLKADLQEFTRRMWVFVMACAAALTFALAAGFVVSAWLQSLITGPILALSRVARRIGMNKDFSLRAPPGGRDEIGQLITSFNEMLGEIGARDEALRRARSELEERVQERTADLRSEVEERRRAEEALRQAVLAAEAASRAKSEFLAVVSHEIRTPMNGVIGCTNLLFETPLSGEQREYAQTIQSSGRALLTLINDILDFSKIEAGRMELDQTQFDLGDAVEEVSEILAPQAEAKGLELVLSRDPAAQLELIGDPGRVRQVLMNLVGNAIKFTLQGHVSIELTPDQSGGGRFVRCSVRDTGIGIPEDKIPQLFQAFTQVDSSTTRRFGGTGLGLAISRRLVELMGGRIGVESTPGVGSTFWFSLPVPAVAEKHTQPQGPADFTGMRVLVVDDLEVNRKVLAAQLRVWGIAHQAVASGEEALQVLREVSMSPQRFHVALVDHLMPGMDGEDLGRAILEDPGLRKTALIMVTSGGRRGDARRFLQMGFSAYLVKPVVRPSQLLTALRRAWEKHPARTQAKVNGHGRKNMPLLSSSVSTAPSRNRESAASSNGAHRRRVLVVEDNAVNQRVAVRMLERLDCLVDVAGDGCEAVAMVRRFPYDIVFMDCLMPEMDGFEATAAIRRYEQELAAHNKEVRRIPIVALTANALSQDRDRCLSVGMDDHLSKPVILKALAEKLERWAPLAKPAHS